MIETIVKRLKSLKKVNASGIEDEVRYFLALIDVINSFGEYDSLHRTSNDVVIDYGSLKLPSCFNGMIYPKAIKLINSIGYKDFVLRESLNTYSLFEGKSQSRKKIQNDNEEQDLVSSQDNSVNSNKIYTGDVHKEVLLHNLHLATFAGYFKKSEGEIVSGDVNSYRVELTLLNSLDRVSVNNLCHYNVNTAFLPVVVDKSVNLMVPKHEFSLSSKAAILRFINNMTI